jgi:broad specificity phosphatase PhoE
MNTITRLVLIRHGEVEARYQRVFGGRIDMDLSERGHEQARRVAEHLRTTHFDAVYASPMRRAQQTVAALAATNGYAPVVVDELREVDFGAWTGLTWDEVHARFGVSAFDWLAELSRNGIAGAEPAADFCDRAARVLQRVVPAHRGQTVALVCHGGVIRMLLSQLLTLPLPAMAHFEVDYASISLVWCRPHRAELKLLNHTPWTHQP